MNSKEEEGHLPGKSFCARSEGKFFTDEEKMKMMMPRGSRDTNSIELPVLSELPCSDESGGRQGE